MLALLGLILAFGASSCGSSASGPNSPPAPDNVLQASDFSHYPQGSVERAFLEYWSALQFQSWADVAAFYDPGLREFVGTASLIGAKELGASDYPLLKPEIVKVKDKGAETTVYFKLRFADGSQELGTTTWRREDGNWEMLYDSRLDAELSQLAQNRVELKRTGTLPLEAAEVSERAAQAGIAASQLQARFLQQELKER